MTSHSSAPGAGREAFLGCNLSINHASPGLMLCLCLPALGMGEVDMGQALPVRSVGPGVGACAEQTGKALPLVILKASPSRSLPRTGEGRSMESWQPLGEEAAMAGPQFPDPGWRKGSELGAGAGRWGGQSLRLLSPASIPVQGG